MIPFERTCDQCGTPYLAKRSTSRYCTSRCRAIAANERKIENEPAPGGRLVALPGGRTEPAAPPEDDDDGEVTKAVRKELTDASRLDTVAGWTALALARRMDQSAKDTGSAVAALARELRSAVGDAMKGAAPADELDAIRRRKDGKVGS